MLDHERNLTRIRADTSRAAYCALVERTAKTNLKMENNTGAVAAIKCYDGGSYIFSFCSYQEYVSFYLRPDAIERWKGIHAEAVSMFERVEQNPSGETIVKVGDQLTANKLADWLYSKL